MNGKNIREIINPTETARVIFAIDELGISRDDFAFMNVSLNSDSINDFYETVTRLHTEYKELSTEEFLCRSFIFSGKYLTFAGALMFSDIIRVKAELKYSDGQAEIQELNIWNAYKNILPRLTAKISGKSALIFRKTFVNALLHSDYNIDNKINIKITPRPARISIDNPGIIRDGVRNKRLEKIFRLSGILSNDPEKIAITLTQDILNFRTRAEFKIEGLKKLPEPTLL